MKSIVLEKHEFENGDESILKTNLSIVVSQVSTAQNEFIASSTQYSRKNEIFSTAILVEEVEL